MSNPRSGASSYSLKPFVEYSFKSTFTAGSCHGCVHRHSHIQFVYVYSGRMSYYLGDDTLDLEVGDLLIVNPEELHGFAFVPEGETAVAFILGCSGFRFPHLPESHCPIPEDGPVLHCPVSMRTEILRCANKMLFESGNGLAGKEEMLNSYAVQFLLYLYREISTPQKSSIDFSMENYSKTAIVKEIIHYMHSHYMERITLDLLSKTMYLSPVYISKIFKEETGEPPINYLIKIRLEHARDLLTPDNDDSIKDIANQVGYDDVYHFSKLFKKYYGISPLYYKKIAAGK